MTSQLSHPHSSTCRFQPRVERNFKFRHPRPWAGPGSLRGGGLRQGVQERLHRTVHSSVHVRPTRWGKALALKTSNPTRTIGSLWNLCLIQNSSPRLSPLPGYRHIHLLSKDGTAIPPSSLFVNISISELTWSSQIRGHKPEMLLCLHLPPDEGWAQHALILLSGV